MALKYKTFNGKRYFLYANQSPDSVPAKEVATLVRKNGGLARVDGNKVWARKTAKWQ